MAKIRTPPTPPERGEKIAPRSPLKGGEQNPPERRSPSPHPLIREEKKRAQLLEDEIEFEEEDDAGFEVEPDASTHEPVSGCGMTAARAWSAAVRQLQMDMPKAAYDKWVRDAVLLSAWDGTFAIGAQSGYARDWLECRLTSTITRLLVGICNRSMQVRFVDLATSGHCPDPQHKIV